MQYWEEMQSKWGFSDGEVVPSGAEEYRNGYGRSPNLTALWRTTEPERVTATLTRPQRHF